MNTGGAAFAGTTGVAVFAWGVTDGAGFAGDPAGGRGCGAEPSCSGAGPDGRGAGGRLAPFVDPGPGFGLGLTPAARRGRSAAPWA
jgi:hypothetical protein